MRLANQAFRSIPPEYSEAAGEKTDSQPLLAARCMVIWCIAPPIIVVELAAQRMRGWEPQGAPFRFTGCKASKNIATSNWSAPRHSRRMPRRRGVMHASPSWMHPIRTLTGAKRVRPFGNRHDGAVYKYETVSPFGEAARRDP